MNILNHSIPSSGQPLLPPKVSGTTQDPCQHLPMSQSAQGSHGLKPFQSNSSKNNSLVVTTGDHPLHTDVSSKKESFQFAPIAQSFLSLLTDNEKFVRIDGDVGNNLSSSEPAFVLSVAVASAVKLEARQIELIARKVQKLTGFKNLKLENTIDPSLIAGFTISYGDDESSVIDLSVKGQLASLAARVESTERRIASNDPQWSSLSA